MSINSANNCLSSLESCRIEVGSKGEGNYQGKGKGKSRRYVGTVTAM